MRAAVDNRELIGQVQGHQQRVAIGRPGHACRQVLRAEAIRFVSGQRARLRFPLFVGGAKFDFTLPLELAVAGDRKPGHLAGLFRFARAGGHRNIQLAAIAIERHPFVARTIDLAGADGRPGCRVEYSHFPPNDDRQPAPSGLKATSVGRPATST